MARVHHLAMLALQLAASVAAVLTTPDVPAPITYQGLTGWFE